MKQSATRPWPKITTGTGPLKAQTGVYYFQEQSGIYFYLFGLLGAIVLIYLLIVVNFQSWLDPFVIITALSVCSARILRSSTRDFSSGKSASFA